MVAISKTVPITGSAALSPGNGVLSLNINALIASKTKPISPMNFLVLNGGIRTSKAPRPSSQALVGKE